MSTQLEPTSLRALQPWNAPENIEKFRGSYSILDPNGLARETLENNVVGGGIRMSDLVRITVPAAGATRWQWTDITGEETAEAIEGLLVYFTDKGTLWPTEKLSGSRPLLVTYDMENAWQVGEDFGDIDPIELEKCRLPNGAYSWQDLPWTKFGTKERGGGKRGKESIMLFLLRPGTGVWPVIVEAPPSSISNVRKVINNLPASHFRCVVRLKLEKHKSDDGHPYSKILMEVVPPPLDDESAAFVKRNYKELFAKVVAGRSFASSMAGGGDGEEVFEEEWEPGDE